MGADGALIYMDSNDWWRFKQSYTYDHMLGVDILGFRWRIFRKPFGMLFRFLKSKNLPKMARTCFAKICVNTILGLALKRQLEMNIQSILMIYCHASTYHGR